MLLALGLQWAGRRAERRESPMNGPCGGRDEFGRCFDPVAKSLSGGEFPGLDRDVVSERFGQADQASGEAVRGLAGEVVAGEVAVDLAGLEHVPGGREDRVFAAATTTTRRTRRARQQQRPTRSPT
jgi:hypothetical protein